MKTPCENIVKRKQGLPSTPEQDSLNTVLRLNSIPMLLLVFGGLSLLNRAARYLSKHQRWVYSRCPQPHACHYSDNDQGKKEMSAGSISRQLNLKINMTCLLSTCSKKITYTPNLLCCIDDCNFRRNTKSHLKSCPHHFSHLPNFIHRSIWVDGSLR